ncbi:ATP-binding cassette domain-containing protein [Alistipes sp. ZOR0009]|uniref:ATP-binding cassette domain-containing protein n=1 Tax=Alistipes sp. ZOR0009 TaxID=1339253 RepID=UPI000647D8FD|nr:ATP-binding cassette domain-containing protein [Alistipes sp. ZOR0009]
MSEEILRALMQLFAIVVKQDDGVELKEREYVENFLVQQLNEDAVKEYVALFEQHAGLRSTDTDDEKDNRKGKLTSVKDSVRILGICKKINKTLTQRQKIIVLVRLFELVNSEGRFSEQRMAIINTVAEVFNLAKEEFKGIQDFVLNNSLDGFDSPEVLTVHSSLLKVNGKQIVSEGLSGAIAILQIKSVELYFLKYTGKDDIFLNGLPINNKRIYLFANGSTIRLPKAKPIYYSDVLSRFMADENYTRLSYEVQSISYQFKTGNLGLRKISFSEEQGKLVGIMGASGAGKTTLLNVLSGIERPTEGAVLINGIDLHSQREDLKGIIGFIPQDDLLIEELTVFENLYYNAKLCFKDKSDVEIRELVEKTLLNLGLIDQKDLKVGSPLNKMISGGQRKRLNIALELIREPSILFVDEPTSGLSSRDSENVMDLLRELALKGKLVFVVIHQPSSDIYKMFDNMLILDTGGYLIYQGNPVEAVMYFKRLDAQINSEVGECPSCGNVNPELIFNIIEAKVVDEFGRYTATRKVSPPKWEEHYHENVKLPEVTPVNEAPPAALRIPSKLKQFLVYTLRDSKSKISNVQYVVLNLLEMPVLGFVLSYVTRYIANPKSDIYIFKENENIPIFIFMSIIVALFVGLTLSAEEIFRDRKILKRESFLNLSRFSYLLSKTLILLVLSAIQTFLFVMVANTVLDVKDMYLSYWLVLFSTSVFANLLGLNISATFNSVVTIYIVIPLLMIPMMVLSGAMFTFEKLNRTISSTNKVPVIADLMATKWGYEALVVRQFKDNEFEKYFYDIEKEESKANYKLVCYIPELQKRLDQNAEALKNRSLPRNEELLKDNLAVLHRAFEREAVAVPEIRFNQIGSVDYKSYSNTVNDAAYSYTEDLVNYYGKIFAKYNGKKEAVRAWMVAKNEAIYNQLRAQYHNESITDLVKRPFEKNKVLQFGDELVQQYEPIFKDPEPKGYFDFRSHFLAPQKHFAGVYFDTFWFNLFVIWGMSILLFVALYFELFKKLLFSFPSKVAFLLHRKVEE